MQLDLLSLQLHFDDFWVWLALNATHFRPRVVVIHYNSHIPPNKARTVRQDAIGRWDGRTNYYGASLGALVILAASKGYSVVYCESHGCNCFFVRNDELGFDDCEAFGWLSRHDGALCCQK